MAAAVFPWEQRPSGKRPGRAAVIPANALVPYPVAQDRFTHEFLWLRRCPACGKVKVCRAQVRTCSKSCGNVMGHFRASKALKLRRMLPKMQRLATQARIANRDARIRERIQGLTPEQIWRTAYDQGYASGHAAGRNGYGRLGETLEETA